MKKLSALTLGIIWCAAMFAVINLPNNYALYEQLLIANLLLIFVETVSLVAEIYSKSEKFKNVFKIVRFPFYAVWFYQWSAANFTVPGKHYLAAYAAVMFVWEAFVFLYYEHKKAKNDG